MEKPVERLDIQIRTSQSEEIVVHELLRAKTGDTGMYAGAYRYWCDCGTELTDGPSGGGATNAVCERCNINYGCLPGYWGH